jgi:hypothetical protein
VTLCRIKPYQIGAIMAKPTSAGFRLKVNGLLDADHLAMTVKSNRAECPQVAQRR